MSQLRAAVIGAGRQGRLHLARLAERNDIVLTGLADVSEERLRAAPRPDGCRAVRDYRELLDDADVVAIAVPTASHYAVARDCLEAGLHVLLEKPMTRTLEEADALIELAARRGRCLAVGHVERCNPAFVAMRSALGGPPVFLESERLAAFQGRGTDIDVVLDLMIHDIDLALALAGGEVSAVMACGYKVLTDSVDIACAHIEFSDGAVAILSASRVSQAPVRKFRAFARDGYASADLHGASLKLARRATDGRIAAEERAFTPYTGLTAQIDAFLRAVRNGAAPAVSGHEGRRALAIALEVGRCIESRLARLAALEPGGAP